MSHFATYIPCLHPPSSPYPTPSSNTNSQTANPCISCISAEVRPPSLHISPKALSVLLLFSSPPLDGTGGEITLHSWVLSRFGLGLRCIQYLNIIHYGKQAGRNLPQVSSPICRDDGLEVGAANGIFKPTYREGQWGRGSALAGWPWSGGTASGWVDGTELDWVWWLDWTGALTMVSWHGCKCGCDGTLGNNV
jgi:hypothetical protein